MEKEGFIYIWYDCYRKMFYLGCHWGTEDDGYICSSNRMRDAHRRRPQDFRRRIIQKGIEKASLKDVEHMWLRLIKDEELGTRFYNLTKQKSGFGTGARQNARYWLGKRRPVETKVKISQALKGRSGTAHTADTKAKMSQSKKGKVFSEEHRRKLSEARKGKTPFKGHSHSNETKQKISEAKRLTSQN